MIAGRTLGFTERTLAHSAPPLNLVIEVAPLTVLSPGPVLAGTPSRGNGNE